MEIIPRYILIKDQSFVNDQAAQVYDTIINYENFKKKLHYETSLEMNM